MSSPPQTSVHTSDIYNHTDIRVINSKWSTCIRVTMCQITEWGTHHYIFLNYNLLCSHIKGHCSTDLVNGDFYNVSCNKWQTHKFFKHCFARVNTLLKSRSIKHPTDPKTWFFKTVIIQRISVPERFQVITVVKMLLFLWVLMPCEHFSPENEGNMFLWNVHMVSQHRRPASSCIFIQFHAS
jgi:hypothetical protein